MLLLLWCFGQTSFGSLVIMIYHNEAMYVAGDSAVTSAATMKRSGSTQKVYPFGENCCAAMTGFAGNLTKKEGEEGFSTSLSDELRQECARQATNSVPLDQKVASIATAMNQTFTRYHNLIGKDPGTKGKGGETMMAFFGYDAAKDCFFTSQCLLGQTNTVDIKRVREYRGPNNGAPFFMQGEYRFLQAALAGATPQLQGLVFNKFRYTFQWLESADPMDDVTMTNLILKLYALHTDNSVRMGYNRGTVGPPYDIFKITKQKVTELTSRPLVRVSPAESNSGLHKKDDEAIDAVMEKLMQSFRENDYSYAFEVMYPPILESLGGKEKLMAAIPALMEQVKQQKLQIISCETRKPYVYLKGKARWYAVIPYTSEADMAGQKLKITAFQLGIKNEDSEWRFIGGDKVTRAMMKKFFPDFPKDYVLPKIQREIE